MATMRRLAVAFLLAAGSLCLQAPARACDERVVGSCKPEPMMDSGGDKAEPAAAPQKTTRSKAKTEARRRGKRSARRASIRIRVAARKHTRHQTRVVAQSSREDRKARPRDEDASSVRRRRDNVDTVGQESAAGPDQILMQPSQAVPNLGTGFSTANRSSATLPMPAKPLDPNAGSLVTAPQSASPGPPLPASPVQVIATQSAPAPAAVSVPASQEQQSRAVAKPEEASDLSPLRMAFLVFAGALALGTVVRLVIG